MQLFFIIIMIAVSLGTGFYLHTDTELRMRDIAIREEAGAAAYNARIVERSVRRFIQGSPAARDAVTAAPGVTRIPESDLAAMMTTPYRPHPDYVVLISPQGQIVTLETTSQLLNIPTLSARMSGGGVGLDITLAEVLTRSPRGPIGEGPAVMLGL